MDIPKWMMQDPAKIYERKQALEQKTKESRQERAAREIKELFKEAPIDADNK